MIQRSLAATATRLAIVVASLIALSACATAPTNGAFAVGQQATLEGRVVSVDTAPWAYDGNAVVTVATPDTPVVRVQLPARWNLCKAPPPDDVQLLKAGDRVQVVGAWNQPGELVVCGNPQDRLRRID